MTATAPPQGLSDAARLSSEQAGKAASGAGAKITSITDLFPGRLGGVATPPISAQVVFQHAATAFNPGKSSPLNISAKPKAFGVTLPDSPLFELKDSQLDLPGLPATKLNPQGVGDINSGATITGGGFSGGSDFGRG